MQLFLNFQSDRMLSKVTNIKVSINCSKISLDSVKDICEKNNLNTKVFSNFIIFESKFVYTIFKSKQNNNYNHINITKIKTKKELIESIKLLKYLNIIIVKKTLKIDNVTGSLDLKKQIILKELVNLIDKYQFNGSIDISYNNEVFPGLFIKVKQENKKIGTIIIFHSGKVVFVGIKSIKKLKCLESLILAITNMK